ncbi:MAG: PhnD/SsuA/transferrin family substrate-binding protein [Caulobacteraceae bacterium]|nr:PhnD/SsuA/transferrin family substrate-binding protein [Caulobacteraceae bacterium]
MRAWLPLAAVLCLAASSAEAASLRIAEVVGSGGACHALRADAPAGEKAYFRLLGDRLGREILTCPVVDRAAAAQALATGRLDVALLDPAAYAPVQATTRAILTVRPAGHLNRIPLVVVTKASGPATNLASLRGKSLVFGGSAEAALAAPRQALADQGAGPGFFSREDVAADADAAAAGLRSGAADALVLNTAAWQRLCQGVRSQDNRCGDLKVVWRGRRRATLALVVRRDIPDELRFRLIGIHVAMHIEAPGTFAWASSWLPGGAEFEPTEAEALALAAR